MTQTIINLGTGGAALNGQNGSTAGADSNDALFLDWDGMNYVYLSGVSGNFLSVPDEAALDITGDIDIRVQVALDDWTPAADGHLLSKYLGAGSGRSYKFRLTSGGLLSLDYTQDGTNIIARTSTVATGILDGARKWVRVSLDVDNGASQNDVRFFLSDDGATWTQLGATVTTAGTTSIFSGNAATCIGAEHIAGVNTIAAKVYRAQVLNGINGTTVLDVDTSVITSGAATSFTALTGQAVTINRSTAGRKSVAVVSPVWLFGTDDFMEVADNALLDFGATDSFTVVMVVRPWGNQISNGTYFAKIDGSWSGAGYSLNVFSSNLAQNRLNLVDTSGNSRAYNGAIKTMGTLAITGIRVTRSTNTVTDFLNSTISSGADISTIGSLANSLPLRIGNSSTGAARFNDFELLAVAVFRRALSPTEISAITTYYQARLS